MIDAYASLPHYLDHWLPIWFALQPGERGTLWVSERLAERAASEGLEHRIGYPPRGDRLTLVASHADSDVCRRAGRSIVYLEHGAGQTYSGAAGLPAHPSYSGGPGYEHARLFLCPSERVAQRWRDAYPGTPAVAVGCPKLDAFHMAHSKPSGEPPVVAFTFHADIRLLAESRWAWPHYAEALPLIVGRLRAEGVEVIGHAHPRVWERLAPHWRRMGVEAVPDAFEVLRRADLLVADNTSLLYEFATLGRPVVVLNAPWYRRDVHHGLRYWDLVPGPQCDELEQVVPTVLACLAGQPQWDARRAEVVGSVYASCDGKATCRAVEAIRSAMGAKA